VSRKNKECFDHPDFARTTQERDERLHMRFAADGVIVVCQLGDSVDDASLHAHGTGIRG
jgi:hypothetical protein